jgi:hypothetical protein
VLSILWLYLLYAGPASVLCALVWFLGRKKVEWYKWEYLILIAPWILYLVSLKINSTPTENAGYLFYPFIFGFAAPFVPIMRIVLGQKINQKAVAAIALILFCIIIFLIPYIPAFDPGPWMDR